MTKDGRHRLKPKMDRCEVLASWLMLAAGRRGTYRTRSLSACNQVKLNQILSLLD